jgi:hypothetical protein
VVVLALLAGVGVLLGFGLGALLLWRDRYQAG